jgi:hypothetical protein
MGDSSDNLTAKQHKAIAALMSSSTVAKAAAAVGVNERTIYTWLEDADFDAAYRVARVEAVQQAIALLQKGSSAAVGVLLNLLTTGTPTVKLGAARTVLEMAFKAVELEDVRDELEQLRTLVQERLGNEPPEL